MTDAPITPNTPAAAVTPEVKIPTAIPTANQKSVAKPNTPAAKSAPASNVDVVENITVGADGMVPLKINGVEKRMPLAEALKLAQKADSADQRFKQAADLDRNTKQQQAAMVDFVNQLKTDPRKVLSDPRLGLDLRNFAETYLGEQIQREMQEQNMTPEQKQMRDMKAKLDEYEAESTKSKEAQKEAAKTAEAEKMVTQMQAEIQDALEKTGIHRDKKYAIAKMAFHMQHARNAGFKPSWEEVAVHVKKEISGGLSDYAKGYQTDEELAESLGEDTIKRINQYMINKVKGGYKAPTQPAQAEQKPSKSKKGKKMNYEQFRESLNEKFGTDLS